MAKTNGKSGVKGCIFKADHVISTVGKISGALTLISMLFDSVRSFVMWCLTQKWTYAVLILIGTVSIVFLVMSEYDEPEETSRVLKVDSPLPENPVPETKKQKQEHEYNEKVLELRNYKGRR